MGWRLLNKVVGENSLYLGFELLFGSETRPHRVKLNVNQAEFRTGRNGALELDPSAVSAIREELQKLRHNESREGVPIIDIPPRTRT